MASTYHWRFLVSSSVGPSDTKFITAASLDKLHTQHFAFQLLAWLIEGNLSKVVMLMNYDKPFACQAEVPAFLL